MQVMERKALQQQQHQQQQPSGLGESASQSALEGGLSGSGSGSGSGSSSTGMGGHVLPTRKQMLNASTLVKDKSGYAPPLLLLLHLLACFRFCYYCASCRRER